MNQPSLTYQTYTSDPVPMNTTDLVPNGDRRMFSPLTTTLISGERDAVLVDPPMTIDQSERVGDWIAASGKNLTHIYVTHGHGDHWFGTAPLLRRFPHAEAVATAGTIAMMRQHGSPEFRAALWDAQFPGQIPDSPVLATPLPGNKFSLEGHDLIALEVGHSDTDDTTVLHVPSISLVVAGDVVYNGVHQYLREAADDGITRWLRALDQVEALKPAHVVSGHTDPTRDDSPATIATTRDYLTDAQRLLEDKPSAVEFFDAMLALHPDRLNPGALWGGALALLG
ncbi:MBL fold metallo-hydrolase [Kribbella sp. ALI-6-A]|uniref:MBL fold metallo-hydrolase n=1 Tax=Kribbella sp. ALI-6-A TaxID=1933817 RepID=UPI00097C80FE|nr:MBL fold metallo-hydrolase [Kribbella sp. ALI-6-A]ONI73990.1 MBL fold metallo-hydrolase [Kribbella sp. ALI-6-A]